MRDRDVRQALLSHLAEMHSGDPDTLVVEEMGVWGGSARIDIAVINGELTGFELKSDRDTLDRLPLQAEIYNLVFDRVALVSTQRHLRKAKSIIPPWWGTYVVSEAMDGTTALRPQRAAKLNPGRDPLIVAQLLWREEALQLLERHGIAHGYRTKTAKLIHQRLATELPLQLLTNGVREALKARSDWLRKIIPNPFDVPVNSNLNPSK